MKQKIIAIICVLSLILCAVSCGEEEEKASSTTVTGTVVSIDGSKVTIQLMDSASATSFGNRPSMPEGLGGQMPEGFDGQPPENFNPEDFQGQMPEDFEGKLPEDFEGKLPEDFQGKLPGGGERPNVSITLDENAETRTIDIGKAHISVEIDDGKASGTMDDVKVGSFITVTLNEKGEATNVLVAKSSGFGGMMGQMGQGQRPQRGDRDQKKEENTENSSGQAA